MFRPFMPVNLSRCEVITPGCISMTRSRRRNRLAGSFSNRSINRSTSARKRGGSSLMAMGIAPRAWFRSSVPISSSSSRFSVVQDSSHPRRETARQTSSDTHALGVTMKMRPGQRRAPFPLQRPSSFQHSWSRRSSRGGSCQIPTHKNAAHPSLH